MLLISCSPSVLPRLDSPNLFSAIFHVEKDKIYIDAIISGSFSRLLFSKKYCQEWYKCARVLVSHTVNDAHHITVVFFRWFEEFSNMVAKKMSIASWFMHFFQGNNIDNKSDYNPFQQSNKCWTLYAIAGIDIRAKCKGISFIFGL